MGYSLLLCFENKSRSSKRTEVIQNDIDLNVIFYQPRSFDDIELSPYMNAGGSLLEQQWRFGCF